MYNIMQEKLDEITKQVIFINNLQKIIGQPKKNIKERGLPLQNIQEHQIEYIRKALSIGEKSLSFIEFYL